MSFKISHNALRGLGLAMMLITNLPAHADASLPEFKATPYKGLRVVSAIMHQQAGTSVVETRISRGLANRVIAPQQLRIAIVAADGAVRAERVQFVGPAQLARNSSRDAHLSTRLNAVVGPNERLVVQWLGAAHL